MTTKQTRAQMFAAIILEKHEVSIPAENIPAECPEQAFGIWFSIAFNQVRLAGIKLSAEQMASDLVELQQKMAEQAGEKYSTNCSCGMAKVDHYLEFTSDLHKILCSDNSNSATAGNTVEDVPEGEDSSVAGPAKELVQE